MKKLLILSTILIFLLSFNLNTAMAKTVEIFNIQVITFENGKATINFSTNDETKTYTYFGTSPDYLNSYVGDNTYKKNHSVGLTGLKRDQNYYYKIVAVNEDGDRAESFLGYLDKDNMNDTIAPKINNFKILQTTDEGLGFSFLTDEKSWVEIYYGPDLDNLKNHKKFGKKILNHTLILTGLKSNSKYYMKVVVWDEDNNSSMHITNFTTSNYNDYKEIKVSQLRPASYTENKLMPENAAITFRTNVLSTAEIWYGTNPDSLRSKQVVSTEQVLEHKAILNNLNPNTTYYFKLKLKSDLNKQKYETAVYSFGTGSLSWNYLDLYYHTGDIVSSPEEKVNYLIYEHNKIPFNNKSYKNKAYDNSSVETASLDRLQEYQTIDGYYGLYYTGQVVKEAKKNTVYVIDGQYKRPLANWAVFTYLNYSTDDIIVAEGKDLRAYITGDPVYDSRELANGIALANQAVVKSENGNTVFLIANGKKLPFLNEQAFYNHGHRWPEVQSVAWYLLSSIPTGQVIID